MYQRQSFLDALKNWRSSLRRSREQSGQASTVDSAVRLWKSSAKRNKQEFQKESETTSKKARIEEEANQEGQAKLNRSPTKVLLLTNVAPATKSEEAIKADVDDSVKKFAAKECRVLKVPGVPEEDAIRVFVVFDTIQASSKAYAALRGQVKDGRPLRARFYDEKRFNDGELYKVPK